MKLVCEQLKARADKPHFSICIPAYNDKETILQCIDSVLNQSFTDFEIVVVDDCSTDGQWEILQEKYGANGKIKILRNEENAGSLYSRAKAIAISSGKYIVSLDADDFLLDDALRELHNAYVNKGHVDIL